MTRVPPGRGRRLVRRAGRCGEERRADPATTSPAFDVWDRFDFDGDGVRQRARRLHRPLPGDPRREDESAGAEPWAIWAHRSAVNYNGDVGPAGNENGGIQIGDTGFWIRDYTTEPENGGLGVFAHEFAHDLGVPDYYDTQDGDNSTGFWTLMSQGSWQSHGDGAIGTTPMHMGAPDKLFLGWYGPDDLKVVDGTAAPQELDLGPSYHATEEGAQALAVSLPQGSATVDVVEPDQGTHYLYSGNGDERVATATSSEVTVPAADPTLVGAGQLLDRGRLGLRLPQGLRRRRRDVDLRRDQPVDHDRPQPAERGLRHHRLLGHPGRRRRLRQRVDRPHGRPHRVGRRLGAGPVRDVQRRGLPRARLLGRQRGARRRAPDRRRGRRRRLDARRLPGDGRRVVHARLRPVLPRREPAVRRLRRDARRGAVQLRLLGDRARQGGPLQVPGRPAGLVLERPVRRRQHQRPPGRRPRAAGRRGLGVRALDAGR